MNSTHTLTFLWTPWSAGASVVLVLAAAGLCFTAWRRSGYRASMGLLELLRLALVIVAALLLNQPEVVQEFRPEEKPTIAVLWDASPSMETRDATEAGSREQGAGSGEQGAGGVLAQRVGEQAGYSRSGSGSKNSGSKLPAPSSPLPALGPYRRNQAIAALADAAFWKQLDERFEVVVQPFSGPGGPSSTDLYGPLATAPARFRTWSASC